MTAQDERAAVVAWLRERRATPTAKSHRALANIWADAIERGDHITPGGE